MTEWLKSLSILLGISIITLSACDSGASKEGEHQNKTAHNTLSEAEIKDGWKLLFDGKTTKGWHVYNHGDTTSKWSVENGELWCNPKSQAGDFGDLVSDSTYQNFEMTYDWKIAKGGNGGVFINVQESPKNPTAYMTGLEMQLLDNENGEERHKINPTHWAGCLYDISGKAENSKPKPFGEWNHSRIVHRDGRVIFFLNGLKTADATITAPDWKTKVQKSNLRNFPDFAKAISGKIALQDHTDAVWFRNMKIREL
ncbi:DUF1080 domain-containing protein [Siphonobacter sp. SORGH_AS_0500]|uniref:3-keto-disaccharide hydrolase n=1 Tax=Siphonobacter sp. SORGH_AS_0500 TaxID=1864824 RepID=UPI00286261A2|nr:DUF1080 domain-containing protein [Siphonobacter sp. SORGH_AS_0500]MDR6196872.1 hypothetical protein [Siphonobacter sp. SORGH_AS_0500]